MLGFLIFGPVEEAESVENDCWSHLGLGAGSLAYPKKLRTPAIAEMEQRGFAVWAS